VAIDSNELKAAKKDIIEFRRNFMNKYSNPNKKKDTVYNLGFYLFNLTTNHKEIV
jgi:hypothetical protein